MTFALRRQFVTVLAESDVQKNRLPLQICNCVSFTLPTLRIVDFFILSPKPEILKNSVKTLINDQKIFLFVR